MKSETVKVERREIAVGDIVIMLRKGAQLERGQIKTGWDQDIGEPIYKDVGVIKFCEDGAETTITLNMSEMVEIIKHLVK